MWNERKKKDKYDTFYGKLYFVEEQKYNVNYMKAHFFFFLMMQHMKHKEKKEKSF